MNDRFRQILDAGVRAAGVSDKQAAEYITLVKERLRKGEQEYSDQSLERPVSELVAEIVEEAADLSGWCWPLLCALEREHGELSQEQVDQLARLVELGVRAACLAGRVDQR